MKPVIKAYTFEDPASESATTRKAAALTTTAMSHMTSWEVATKTTRPDAAALAREFQEEGIVLPKPNSAINDKVAIYRGDSLFLFCTLLNIQLCWIPCLIIFCFVILREAFLDVE